MSGYIGDSTNFNGNAQQINQQGFGAVSTMPGDHLMMAIFYVRPIHNAILSDQAGRPIYEDKDYIRIQMPGDKYTIVDREASLQDKRRWSAQWEAYRNKKDQVAVGTPLGLLFPSRPAQVAMLQALGFTTVEQVADASSTGIEAMGGNGQAMVNYAQEYLKRGAAGSSFHQVNAELESTKRQNESLQRQIDQLTERLEYALQPEDEPAPRTVARRVQRAIPEPISGEMPSFGSSETSEEAPARKGGWPKGKPRTPKTPAAGDAA